MSYAIKFSIHLALLLLSFLAAYGIRRGLAPQWWLVDPAASALLMWGIIYTGIGAAVELVFKTERTSWRFSSAREVLKIGRNVGVTALIFLLVMFLRSRADMLPRSVVVLAWMMSVFLLVGARLVLRLIHDPALARSLFSYERIRLDGSSALILIGDVHEAEAYLRRGAAGARREYKPVALVTPERRPKGQLIHGVPIIGTTRELVAALPAYFEHQPGDNAAILFLQDPTSTLGLTAEQIGWLRAQGYRLLREPKLIDLGGETDAPRLREIKLEEFLPRAPIRLDPAPLSQLIGGRRVLVTGAGGSIGSEIARQLVSLDCAHITLVDHSEFLLFEIDRELHSSGARASRSAILCNVRDRARVQEVLMNERPDIVFHAAALKHVTLVENNPSEGVLTNVLGTANVAAAARVCGADQMVLISTDKAVNPTNVMGATKRLAEAVLPPESDDTLYCAVRFGNVLGSAGSVVPIFRDQIERGGPVTVTHEAVERFFMTIPEAVQLVLHATALSAQDRRRELRKFVLDMGKPVKIIELARQMIELSGRVPGVDVEIKITGLKPGEKLSEELLATDESVASCVSGINEIQAYRHEYIPDAEVLRIAALAGSGNPTVMRTVIYEALSTLQRNTNEMPEKDRSAIA